MLNRLVVSSEIFADFILREPDFDVVSV
jgi:hypothetical protein